jgi:hypothetical protein
MDRGRVRQALEFWEGLEVNGILKKKKLGKLEPWVREGCLTERDVYTIAGAGAGALLSLVLSLFNSRAIITLPFTTIGGAWIGNSLANNREEVYYLCSCENVTRITDHPDHESVVCQVCGRKILICECGHGIHLLSESTNVTCYHCNKSYRRCEKCGSYAQINGSYMPQCPSCSSLLCDCGKATDDTDNPVYIVCKCGKEWFGKPTYPKHGCELVEGQGITWYCNECNGDYSPFKLFGIGKGKAVCKNCNEEFGLIPEILEHGLVKQSCPCCGYDSVFDLRSLLYYSIIPKTTFLVTCSKCGCENEVELTEERIRGLKSWGHFAFTCENPNCFDLWPLLRHVERTYISDIFDLLAGSTESHNSKNWKFKYAWQ